MNNFFTRVFISALAIAITASIQPGIHILNNDIGTYVLLGLVLGVVNGLLRPILMFLSCPLIILTLGFFALVVNGLMLQLTASILPDRLVIDHFGWAVGGGLIMAIVAMILENALGVNERKEEHKRKRKGRMVFLKD